MPNGFICLCHSKVGKICKELSFERDILSFFLKYWKYMYFWKN